MFFETLSDNFTIKEMAMVHLLAYTGMRKEELGGLYWSDVDFKSKTIRIGKNLAYVDNSYKTYDPKTRKSNRVIKIHDVTVNILKQWKKKQAEELCPIVLPQIKKNNGCFPCSTLTKSMHLFIRRQPTIS